MRLHLMKHQTPQGMRALIDALLATLSLSLSHTHTHSLSQTGLLVMSSSLYHTHTLSLSLSHTHTHTHTNCLSEQGMRALIDALLATLHPMLYVVVFMVLPLPQTTACCSTINCV